LACARLDRLKPGLLESQVTNAHPVSPAQATEHNCTSHTAIQAQDQPPRRHSIEQVVRAPALANCERWSVGHPSSQAAYDALALAVAQPRHHASSSHALRQRPPPTVALLVAFAPPPQLQQCVPTYSPPL